MQNTMTADPALILAQVAGKMYYNYKRKIVEISSKNWQYRPETGKGTQRRTKIIKNIWSTGNKKLGKGAAA